MKDRVALVTGASRGIGLAVATRFEELGARVLAPTRAELDLADRASTERYLAGLDQPIDILVNDAGFNQLAGLEETDDELIRETLEVNLVAPLRLARALAPAMAERGWGRVVNISSVWAVVAKERRLPYIVSKTGLNGLTRAMAVEFGPSGVSGERGGAGFRHDRDDDPEQQPRGDRGDRSRRAIEADGTADRDRRARRVPGFVAEYVHDRADRRLRRWLLDRLMDAVDQLTIHSRMGDYRVDFCDDDGWVTELAGLQNAYLHRR